MADTGIYATTQEIQDKAGNGASTTSKAEAFTNRYVAQAESTINCTARKIFAADNSAFTALPDTTKKILSQIASDLEAIYVIEFDMSGFTSRVEAEDMINILRDAALRGLAILRDTKTKRFLEEAGGN